MLAGHRCSSSRTAGLLVLAGVLAISGCAGRTAMLSQLSGPQPLRLNTIDDAPAVAAATVPAAEPRIRPAADVAASADIIAQAPAEPRSAWCEYLTEDAAADATILRGPILGGQVDDAGNGSVSLSLSMSGMRKAKLLEQSAEARCRRYLAENGLQKLIYLAPMELTAAGFRSKAQAIAQRTAELEKLRRRIRRETANGYITADRAAGLTTMIDSIYATAAEARSQAARRDKESLLSTGPADAYSAALLRAETDLADIDSRMRDADAFDLSLEAGYSDGDVGDGFDSLHDGVSGKLKFSMKLGAMAPRRFAHEKRAKAARIAAIRDQEGGTLWQLKALRRAHQKAITGLEESLLSLDRAITETRRFLTVVESTPDPQFSAAAIDGHLRMIQLQADKAAVSGSIAEIRSKLKQLAPG